MRMTGRYESLGSLNYFIPNKLPPENPPFSMDATMTTLYGEAMHHLGKLNEMTHRVLDKNRFIKAYVIKEALLSSAIEGIHTTLIDVFTQPLLDTRPDKNTQLVLNYTTALSVSLEMLQNGLPISNRVMCSAHKALMQTGEGDKADPGNFRKQAVRVGNLIPPPPTIIQDLMVDLERYINVDQVQPALIKAGLAHVQFETIHPFLDGNGRIGRLLIVLMIIDSGLLSQPLLYPSYYFKKHHMQYYQCLDRVRTQGDFEGWISFYLNAIIESSIDAYRRAQEIEQLEVQLKERIETLKKAQEYRLKALSILFTFPVISITELSSQLDVAYNTAHQIIDDFLKLKILVEETQQKRGKLFRFSPYLAVLEKEYN